MPKIFFFSKNKKYDKKFTAKMWYTKDEQNNFTQTKFIEQFRKTFLRTNLTINLTQKAFTIKCQKVILQNIPK